MRRKLRLEGICSGFGECEAGRRPLCQLPFGEKSARAQFRTPMRLFQAYKEIADAMTGEGPADFLGLAVLKGGHNPANQEGWLRTSGGSPPWSQKRGTAR